MTPNKRFNTGPIQDYLTARQLMRTGGALYFYEARGGRDETSNTGNVLRQTARLCQSHRPCINTATCCVLHGPLPHHTSFSLMPPLTLFLQATCGAGLPIMSTLKHLQATGDRVLRIEGVLSGTLSFLFNIFGKESKSWSECVSREWRSG